MERALNCKICRSAFNLNKRKPTILPCGHECCHQCFRGLPLSSDPTFIECPFDKTKMKLLEKEVFNQYILEQLELKIKPTIYCQFHREQRVEFACLKEKTLGCSQCFETSQTDDIVAMEDLKIQEIDDELVSTLVLCEEKIRFSWVEIQNLWCQNRKIFSNQVIGTYKNAMDLLLKLRENGLNSFKKNVFLKELYFRSKYPQISPLLTDDLSEKISLELRSYDLHKTKLLFKASKARFNFKAFQQQCDKGLPLLVIALTDRKQAIGGFSYQNLSTTVGRNTKVTANQFLFSEQENKIFKSKSNNRSIILKDEFDEGICFGHTLILNFKSRRVDFNKWLKDQEFTFSNTLPVDSLSGDILEVEVYELE